MWLLEWGGGGLSGGVGGQWQHDRRRGTGGREEAGAGRQAAGLRASPCCARSLGRVKALSHPSLGRARARRPYTLNVSEHALRVARGADAAKHDAPTGPLQPRVLVGLFNHARCANENLLRRLSRAAASIMIRAAQGVVAPPPYPSWQGESGVQSFDLDGVGSIPAIPPTQFTCCIDEFNKLA
jgi:hypothetical protein